MSLSYSPVYTQSVIWVCRFTDGSLLREWEDSGKEHLFKEIDRAKLKEFHLVSATFDYYYDCQTGIFKVDGREFVFPLAGLGLAYGEGLIHFKEACTEFVSAYRKRSEYDGFEIVSYEFGWKVTSGNTKSQVIYNVSTKSFSVELTFLDLQKTVSWSVKI